MGSLLFIIPLIFTLFVAMPQIMLLILPYLFLPAIVLMVLI